MLNLKKHKKQKNSNFQTFFYQIAQIFSVQFV